MKIQRSRFGGIGLTSVLTDKFKCGLICFSLIADGGAENTALGLVLAGALRRGTEKYPDMASINRRLDELYASTVEIRSSRLSDKLMLVLGSEILDNKYSADGTDILDGVLEMISEMLLRPRLENSLFPASSVEQECGFVKDAIKAERNNTKAYAYCRCNELMHRDTEGFPTLERLEAAVDSIDAKKLTEHYRYILSCPMEVFYVGALSHSEAEEKIKRYFSDFAGAGSTVLTPCPPDKPREFLSSKEAMPVVQGKLSIGIRTGSGLYGRDHHAALMLNEIFGASPASKLFMNVREKMSLCYYCSSSYDIFSGNIMVSGGINVKNRDIAEKAILEQFEEIRKGNITDTEFNAARRSLENCYKQIYDSPFDIQSFYGIRGMFGVPESVEECLASILSVTKDDIAALARRSVCDTVFFVEGTLDGDENTEEADDE